MDRFKEPVRILIAEDDDEYYGLMEEAMKKNAIKGPVNRFTDGEALLRHLTQRPKTAGERLLILMDLNMPKKTGHEVLKEIRAVPDLRKIPVVIMTVSNDPRDIVRGYEAGANSFIVKPFDFDQLVNTIGIFKQYWLERVELP